MDATFTRLRATIRRWVCALQQVPPVVIATALWGPFDASYVLRSFLNPAFRPARRCVSGHSL